MEKEIYFSFLKGDADFIKNDYPQLGKEEKKSLWIYRLTYDLMSRNPQDDPVSKFTHSNYLEWKSIEPDIDEFIEHAIDEYFLGWNVWFEGARARTVKEEIYRRINEY